MLVWVYIYICHLSKASEQRTHIVIERDNCAKAFSALTSVFRFSVGRTHEGPKVPSRKKQHNIPAYWSETKKYNDVLITLYNISEQTKLNQEPCKIES